MWSHTEGSILFELHPAPRARIAQWNNGAMIPRQVTVLLVPCQHKADCTVGIIIFNVLSDVTSRETCNFLFLLCNQGTLPDLNTGSIRELVVPSSVHRGLHPLDEAGALSGLVPDVTMLL